MNVRALKMLAFVFCFGTLFSAIAAESEAEPEKVKIPASPAKAEERRGLEAGFWVLEPNSNTAEVSSVVAEEQPDNRLVRMAYKGGQADKSAIKKQTGLTLAETGKLHGWIYSDDDNAPAVSVALVTGGDYNWQETQSQKLKKGWNEISFDLAAKTFKSKATEWKHEAGLEKREDVRAIALNVYNGQSSGALYLNGFQADRAGDTTAIQTEVSHLADAATREEAQKEIVKSGRAAIEPLNTFLQTSKDKDANAAAEKLLEKVGGKPAAPK